MIARPYTRHDPTRTGGRLIAMGAAMTPTPDEPTLGEVIRLLDALANQVRDLVKEIKEDRQTNAATFVRQDVYVAQRQADQAVVADLHGEVRAVKDGRQKDTDAQRQRNLAVALTAVSSLVSIAIAVFAVIAR